MKPISSENAIAEDCEIVGTNVSYDRPGILLNTALPTEGNFTPRR